LKGKSLHIDFETYCDLDLSLVGAHDYAAHPSFEILCVGYKPPGDHSQVELWDTRSPLPDSLRDALRDPEVLIYAFNAEFERLVILRYYMMLGMDKPAPVKRYRCVMALSYYNGYSGGLGAVGRQVLTGAEDIKLSTGTDLINKLCKPQKKGPRRLRYENAPDLYQQLYEYCHQDVRAEVAIYDMLPIKALPEQERIIWQHNVIQNDRGFYVDRELVRNILEPCAAAKTKLNDKLFKLTDGEIKTATQNVALAKYLDMESLAKEAVEKELEEDIDLKKREILLIRQQVTKTSTAKYDRLLLASSGNGRVKGLLKYYGARTGRYAGAGMQVQNIPKPPEDKIVAEWVDFFNGGETAELLGTNPGEIIDRASKMIRPCLTATPGHKLVVTDYSSIECVALYWLSEDTQALESIKKGLDPYKIFASKIYQVGYDEITKEQRTRGKVAVLGLGYGMGADLYHINATRMGVDITKAQAKNDVALYRGVNKKITDHWYGLHTAMFNAIKYQTTEEYGKFKLQFSRGNLYLKIPSGRVLSYVGAKIEMMKTSWGEMKDAVTYMALRGYKWVRINNHPGMLTGHVTQGTTRDILCHGSINAEKAGFKVLTTVHDEIVTEVLLSSRLGINELNEAMLQYPDWCAGIPIKVEGYENDRYKK